MRPAPLLVPLLLWLAGVPFPFPRARGAGDGPPAPANLLPDGSLSLWKDGLPEGWELRVGATSGDGGESEIRRGPEGGVLLRGNGKTGIWRILACPVEVRKGAFYRFSFEARATGLRVEGRQFDNAYVGLGLPQERGDLVDRRTIPLVDRAWAPEEILFRAAAAGRAEAWIFLSKSGSLEARDLRLEELAPGDSYDALVRDMGRYYSHFASKGIDWPALAAAHRAAALEAKDEAGFVEAVRGLLAELKDVHVVLRRSDGRTVPTFVYRFAPNYDFRAVAAALRHEEDLGPFARRALAGVAGRDIGYLAVFSLPSSEAEFAPVTRAFEGMLGRRGILLDLRGCTGGDERRAMALASCLARGRVVYSRIRVRSGPAPGDLTPPADRVLEPRAGRRFEGPVVCLLGPGCVSSGEGFAQMMAAIPGVVLAGSPTAGASGNPSPVDLPNGVSVGFSRWVDLLPDGTPLEGHGVVPAVPLASGEPGDPVFAAGLALVEAAAAKAGR